MLKEVSKYAEGILRNLNKDYFFHSIHHTREVVEAAKSIGSYCSLDPYDLELVIISCWFHDTGFGISPFNHKDHSASIAKNFLETRKYPDKNIKKVVGCIRATQLPQNPLNILEAVVCDADMYHLSTSDYWHKNQLLKKETELIIKKKIRNDQWCNENLNFLSQHQYHTEYGNSVLTKHKRAHLMQNVQNLESLKKS